MDSYRLKLALAQLPTRLRRACKLFRELTGLTAVISFRSSARGLKDAGGMRPPVHPLCAALIRTKAEAPCDEQWQAHIRQSLRSRRSHSHTCPLGLLCACVPIFLGETLVGVAKVVVDSDTSRVAFSAATATLALAVSTSCQETLVSVLSDELRSLRQRVAGFRHVQRNSVSSVDSVDAPSAIAGEDATRDDHGTIVHRALNYLHRHYDERDLSLTSVAAALQCNGNYLTQRFTQLVGQHMHSYIVTLRVERACQELLSTDSSVKRIAHVVGFRDAGRLSRVFRRHVGVSPTEYRRIFVSR